MESLFIICHIFTSSRKFFYLTHISFGSQILDSLFKHIHHVCVCVCVCVSVYVSYYSAFLTTHHTSTILPIPTKLSRSHPCLPSLPSLLQLSLTDGRRLKQHWNEAGSRWRQVGDDSLEREGHGRVITSLTQATSMIVIPG